MKALIGIMMTLFLVTAMFTVIPIGAAGWDGTITVAVVGPTGWTQMDGLWVGSTIAAEQVNLGPNGVDDGGDGDDGVVMSNGDNYKIELVDADSHAAEYPPDPGEGWTELQAALDAGAHYVVGGFRTECVEPMSAEFKTYANASYNDDGYAPLWFICGASTTYLIDCAETNPGDNCIRHNYDFARYLFRNTPMNGTYLFMQLAYGILRQYILPTRLYPLYQAPVKTFLIMEDLTWTNSMMYALAGTDWFPYPGVPPSPPSPYSILGTQANVTGIYRTHPVSPDWDAAFSAIEASGARLIIHLYSGPTGIGMVSQWKDRGTNAALVGIDVESQRQEFWDESGGKSEYEAMLDSVGTATNVNPDAEPLSTTELWYEYYSRSSAILTAFHGAYRPPTYPVYTMWGAYGVIMEIDAVVEGYGSWPIPADDEIPQFEMYDETSTAILGNFKYTGPNPNLGSGNYSGYGVNPTFKGTLHELYCHPEVYTPTWPTGYSRSLITQWQQNATGGGERMVIWPQDQLYSRRYRLPPWMYMGKKPMTGDPVSLAWTDTTGPGGVPDGVVDVDDAQLPALAFGAYPGCNPPLPPWNIEADLTADGVIDVDDSQIPALAFGNYADVWPLPQG